MQCSTTLKRQTIKLLKLTLVWSLSQGLVIRRTTGLESPNLSRDLSPKIEGPLLAGYLDICTHFKPTETFQYAHFSSCSLHRVRKGLIKGEALRLLRTSSSAKFFHENIYIFKSCWKFSRSSLKYTVAHKGHLDIFHFHLIICDLTYSRSKLINSNTNLYLSIST